MPDQLDPATAEAVAPPAREAGTAADPSASLKEAATELVGSAPEEVGEAVAANDKAWQAALRARAKADPEVGKRIEAAGLIGVPVGGGSPAGFLWNPDDVLMVSPEEKEVIDEFTWAAAEDAKGNFAEYAGQYLAIVHKTVLAAGADIAGIRAEAAAKAGVEPFRVAIYLVDTGDW